MDFGDRADGGARVAAGGLLLDRDRRRQALDAVHVGLAHQFEELARVGGQAFDVAALALGVDGVESERGFAGAGQAGDDRQAVARDYDIDVFQVVLARAAHMDGAGHADQAPRVGDQGVIVSLGCSGLGFAGMAEGKVGGKGDWHRDWRGR